jgi:hypothetical protein
VTGPLATGTGAGVRTSCRCRPTETRMRSAGFLLIAAGLATARGAASRTWHVEPDVLRRRPHHHRGDRLRSRRGHRARGLRGLRGARHRHEVGRGAPEPDRVSRLRHDRRRASGSRPHLLGGGLHDGDRRVHHEGRSASRARRPRCSSRRRRRPHRGAPRGPQGANSRPLGPVGRPRSPRVKDAPHGPVRKPSNSKTGGVRPGAARDRLPGRRSPGPRRSGSRRSSTS